MPKLKIDTTKKVVEYLDALVRTGLYGRTREEAAERLLCRAIEDALSKTKER